LNNYKKINDSVGKERVRFHDRVIIRNIKEFEVKRNQLEKMIKEYKERNIEVVLITTPVLPTYSKYCNDTIMNKNQKAINYLCKKYNCKYFNYFNDKRFEVRDFLNNDHLNFIGAKYFSKIIDREIVEPIFKK
jgi:hypothetical protein